MTTHVTLVTVRYKQLNWTAMYSTGIGIVEINFVWQWRSATGGCWQFDPWSM